MRAARALGLALLVGCGSGGEGDRPAAEGPAGAADARAPERPERDAGGRPAVAPDGPGSPAAGEDAAPPAAATDAGGRAEAAAPPGPGGVPAAVDCPTTAPFDQAKPGLLAACTKRVLVAVGNAMRRVVSHDDGKTWIHAFESPMPTPGDENENSYTDVTVGQGLLIATGDGGVHRSADGGKTWDLVPAFGKRQHASSIEFAAGRFLLTRWGGGGNWSTDGSTWTEVKIPGNGHSHGIAYGDGKWASIYNGTSVSFSNDDGKTWKLVEFGPWKGGWLESIAFGGGRFVVVGPIDGRRASTKDGVSWEGVANNQTAGAVPLTLEGIAWDGTRFVAGGTGAVTTDGVTWAKLAMNHKVDFVAYDDGLYFGARGPALYTSADGSQWTEVYRAGKYPFKKIAIGRILK